jgi:hypothetical protein
MSLAGGSALTNALPQGFAERFRASDFLQAKFHFGLDFATKLLDSL